MYGVKEFGHLGPLYTKPKAHAEEEEMPEDERRKSKSCSRPTEIIEGKSGMPLKAASQSIPRKRTSTVGQPWEPGRGAIQGETVTSALNTYS